MFQQTNAVHTLYGWQKPWQAMAKKPRQGANGKMVMLMLSAIHDIHTSYYKCVRGHVNVQSISVSASFEANFILSSTASVAHYTEGLWSDKLNNGF